VSTNVRPFAGPSAAAHGQGNKGFGGTWYALTASGNAATGQAASSPSSGGGGYGY
jgi:hypothetical protein